MWRNLISRDNERGAILLIAGIALGALLATAALVVDLSAARANRSRNQVSTDAAAAAGAMSLAQGNGADACRMSLEYVELHLGQPLSGGGCSAFPTVCSALTARSSMSATSGSIRVTIAYPVPDDDSLMSSSSIASPTMAVGSGDGDKCNRIAVEITEQRDVFFGGFVRTPSQTTSVHSVALARNGGENGRSINLLLVNRSGCELITIGGGGSSGGIIVKPVVDPNTGEVHGGSIAADSDGSQCSGNSAVIETSGSGATIRADGVAGCANEISPGTGHGCGEIEVFAAGGPGCSQPACSGSGVVAPGPARQGSRLTRAAIDHRFNCKSSYPASFDIRPCADAASTSSYIDDLVADIGSHGRPSGYENYSPTYPCNVGGGPSTVVIVPEGNWFVNCDLRVARTLRFEGGNIVFDGDVDITSSGLLSVNQANGSNYNWTEGSQVDHLDHSVEAAFVYFRDGDLKKSGGGSLILHNTMLYLSADSKVDMTGGSGLVSFVAPTTGPFEDLALWSESTHEQNFAGGAGLELEGVFFAPYSTVNYNGNGSQTQIAAQFIADKLTVGGNGSLVLAPIYERSVQFPEPGLSVLIR